MFAAPVTVVWEWDERRVAAVGPVAWLYAEGTVAIHSPEGEARRPYRLSGVLVWGEGAWRWAQFHGSEPAQG